MRGVNEDELEDLLAFGLEHDLEVRFIEYMDVGGATTWERKQVLPRTEILQRLEASFGPLEALPRNTDDEAELAAPADRFGLANGGVVGVIASTTAPFCRACDRSRLTADGRWFRCLYAREGTDLRGPLRGKAGPEQLRALIRGHWNKRADRGAEERLGERSRTALASAPELRADPHLEMHTRGG